MNLKNIYENRSQLGNSLRIKNNNNKFTIRRLQQF